MSNQSISDAGESKRYWTQIPNIIFDIGLKPQEIALYAHLKRTVGARVDGKCTKSTDTLVRETGMGAGTISRAKAELARRRADLNDKPLIVIEEVPNLKGGKPNHHITITDIWQINMDRFATSKEEAAVANEVPAEVATSSKPTSRGEIKKNSQEEPGQEKQNPCARACGKSAARPPIHADPDVEMLLTFLEMKNGPIRSRGLEAKAANWLLRCGYSSDQCQRCLQYLAGQAWRGAAVTWETVAREIGAWVNKGEPNLFTNIHDNGRLQGHQNGSEPRISQEAFDAAIRPKRIFNG